MFAGLSGVSSSVSTVLDEKRVVDRRGIGRVVSRVIFSRICRRRQRGRVRHLVTLRQRGRRRTEEGEVALGGCVSLCLRRTGDKTHGALGNAGFTRNAVGTVERMRMRFGKCRRFVGRRVSFSSVALSFEGGFLACLCGREGCGAGDTSGYVGALCAVVGGTRDRKRRGGEGCLTGRFEKGQISMSAVCLAGRRLATVGRTSLSRLSPNRRLTESVFVMKICATRQMSSCGRVAGSGVGAARDNSGIVRLERRGANA